MKSLEYFEKKGIKKNDLPLALLYYKRIHFEKKGIKKNDLPLALLYYKRINFCSLLLLFTIIYKINPLLLSFFKKWDSSKKIKFINN